MEPHGDHQSKIAVAIVPARYASERLPGKMLLPLAGKPVLVRTLERVVRSELITRVIAAVDDPRLLDAAREAGFEAVMTSPDHRSGSDRIAEVAAQLPEGSLVINIQGDEPLIDPATIDRVVAALRDDPAAQMATVREPVRDVSAELFNPNVVKLVCDDDGYARYFSRSPIPFVRELVIGTEDDFERALTARPEMLSLFARHVGIYGYRREYLLRLASLPQSGLEKAESLEQLRALNDRALIKVVESAGSSIGVDTMEDYERVRSVVESLPDGLR